MKKLLYIIFLFSFLQSFSQTETHTFTTYDTTFTVAAYPGLSFRMRISRPTGMFGSGADTASRPAIIFMPGQGEQGSSAVASGSTMATYGPHYWLANGWDGSIVLGNGTHYPIIITIICNNVNVLGAHFSEAIAKILSIYHIKRNSVHCTGLSQGGFASSASIYYERVAGDKFGMRQITSLMCFSGISEWPTDYPNTYNKYSGNAWQQWASEFSGKFLGIEGTGDYRYTEVVTNQVNAGHAGYGYLGYTTSGGGGHCCWNTEYSPSNTAWRSTAPYGTFMAGGGFATAMGTYKDGDYLMKWQLRQGDTSLVGSDVIAADAGADASIIIPTQPSYYGRRATYHIPSGLSLSSQAWTKISGPNTPTLTGNTTDTVTIGNGGTPLIGGSYVYRYTVTASDASTIYDEFTLTVSDADAAVPTVTVTSTNPETISSSSSSVTTSNTAGTGSNTILHSHLIKPTYGPIDIAMWGTSTLWGQGAPVAGTGVFELTSNFFTSNSVATNVYRDGASGLDLFAMDVNSFFNSRSGCSVFFILAPSNSYTTLNNATTIAKFQEIKDTAVARGKTYYFGGMMPRNDYSLADRDNLVVLDSLMEVNFPNHVIHFINYLRDSLNGNRIKAIYNYGDNVHVNALGHAELAKSIIAFNMLATLSSGTSTISTPTTANTNITGLTNGTHKFLVAVKDGSAKSAYAVYTQIVNPVAPVRYNWNTSTGTITINRTNYPTLKAGDTVYIAKKATGSGYDGIIIDSMLNEIQYPDSTVAAQWIHIVFASDAYMSTISSPNFISYLNKSRGIKIYGLKALQRAAPVWDLGKSNGQSGISSYIWVDSFKLVGSLAFENNCYAGFTNATGDSNYAFHHWYYTRFIIDSSYGQGSSYTQSAIKGGSLFAGADTLIWRDVDIKYGTFNYYWGGNAVGGLQPGGSTYVGYLAGFNIKVHDCTFSNHGINLYISAHQADVSINGTADVYNNIFGPNNHSNCVRGSGMGIPSWGPIYMTGIRCWNDFAYRKRKYPMFECGDATTVTPSLVAVRVLLKKYRGYNNFLFNAGEGAAGSGGAAWNNVAYRRVSIWDITGTGDSLEAKNSVVVGPVRDSVTDVAPLAIAWSNGSYVSDMSNNYVFTTWPASEFEDSVNFIPKLTGLLYNRGVQPPPYILTQEYPYGARISGDTIDIGWQERQVGGNVPPIANAGTDQIIQLPTTISSVTSVLSTDADGSIVSQVWSFISGPITPSITTPTSVATGITGLTVAGAYTFEVLVTDNNGAVSTDQVTVTVLAANVPPLCNAGLDQYLPASTTSTVLNGGAVDSDGTIVGYNWTQVSGPSATIATPSPPNGVTTITGLTPGIYVFRLTVTDNGGANGTDDVTVVISNVINNYYRGLSQIKLF